MGAIEDFIERTDGLRNANIQVLIDSRREALAELSSLRQREKRLREMLRRIQWQGADGAGFMACPACHQYPDNVGHRPDCELAALLKEGE